MQSYTNLFTVIFLVALVVCVSEARVLRKYAMNVHPPAGRMAPVAAAVAVEPGKPMALVNNDEAMMNDEQPLRGLKLQQRSDPEVNQDDIVLPMEDEQ